MHHQCMFCVFVFYLWPIKVLFIVRQCCSCWSLCGDCTENTLKKNTAQSCELFRLAQHCKVECRFLKWASGQPCKKWELSPFWYADDTLASSPHKPQRRVRIRSSHRDLQLPPSIWRSTMTHPFDLCFQEEVLVMSSAASENLDGVFDCASMLASPLNTAGEIQFFATQHSIVQN